MSDAKYKALDLTTELDVTSLIGLNIKKYLRGCPDEEHRSRRYIATFEDFKKILKEDKDYFSEVESISLIRFKCSLHHLLQIQRFCPRINCILIISSQFTDLAIIALFELVSNAHHFFSEGSIKTISLADNKATDLSLFAQSCKSLTDLKLNVKPDDCFKAHIFIHLSESFKFLCLDDEQGILKAALKYLTKGPGRNAQFLHFDSIGLNALKAFKYIPKLQDLRGLNIGVKIDLDDVERLNIDIVSYYTHITKCKKLEILILDLLFVLFEANKILEVITEGEFQNVLAHLKLINGQFNKSFQLIEDRFKNLESLKLIQCLFKPKDVNKITETIIKINKLKKLVIKNKGVSDNNRGYIALGFESIQQFINYCPELTYLGVQLEFTQHDVTMLQKLAIVNNIEFRWLSPHNET